jgi:hypothetical protein
MRSSARPAASVVNDPKATSAPLSPRGPTAAMCYFEPLTGPVLGLGEE